MGWVLAAHLIIAHKVKVLFSDTSQNITRGHLKYMGHLILG